MKKETSLIAILGNKKEIYDNLDQMDRESLVKVIDTCLSMNYEDFKEVDEKSSYISYFNIMEMIFKKKKYLPNEFKRYIEYSINNAQKLPFFFFENSNIDQSHYDLLTNYFINKYPQALNRINVVFIKKLSSCPSLLDKLFNHTLSVLLSSKDMYEMVERSKVAHEFLPFLNKKQKDELKNVIEKVLCKFPLSELKELSEDKSLQSFYQYYQEIEIMKTFNQCVKNKLIDLDSLKKIKKSDSFFKISK